MTQPIVEYVGTNGGGVYSPNDEETTNYLVFSGSMILEARQWESDRYDNVRERTESGEPFTAGKDSAWWYLRYNMVPVDGGWKYYTRKFYQNKFPKEDTDVQL